MTRQLHFNAFLMGSGHHEAAWRLPESDPFANTDLRHWINLAQIAERGCFDSLFLADGPALWGNAKHRPGGALEPTVLLTALAAVTSHIGLIATASTTYNDPYNLARRFASLDHISGGRAGWNIVTTASRQAAQNFGLDDNPSHRDRYARAAEFTDISIALWDSWEDDAEIGDKATGVYADENKIHEIDFKGEYFGVRGPLNVPRSPQGRPLLVQAGSSEDGREFAARYAEAVFTAQQTLADAREFYADLKARARRLGRDPDQIKILPGLVPAIGSTEAEARALEDELESLIVPDYGLNHLAQILEVPPEALPLDGHLPESVYSRAPVEGMQSRYQLVVDLARRDDLTVRQLIARLGGGRGHRTFAGTPEQVADTIEEWAQAGAADGFNVMPPVLPSGLEAFVDQVIPLLRKRALIREEYAGTTLRSHYTLPRPPAQEPKRAPMAPTVPLEGPIRPVEAHRWHHRCASRGGGGGWRRRVAPSARWRGFRRCPVPRSMPDISGNGGGMVDPTFYRSATDAIAAPAETLAYVVAFDRSAQQPDALTVIDTDPESSRYGQVVGWADLPTRGDELHHFGWNACSSAFAHADHHGDLQRRYLLLPGLRSSSIHVYDTQPDPRQPGLVKTITAAELADKAGYSRPHTLHCGPDGIFVSCLGGGNGNDGPGGIALLDHETFDVLRAWETDRGPQYLAYDAWWHLNQNTLITSEWGTPSMIEDGVNPELLLSNKYGHALHFWDLAAGKHLQRVDLGEQYQMALELRPSHDPEATWGFVGVVVSTEDLSASVWRWHRDSASGNRQSGGWQADKVITIPAEPADPATLPPALQPFGAVPPLVTDINLSVDDKFLYVSCYGTGELKQYDVSDPARPRETGSVRLGGITGRVPHPAAPDQPLAGGPQMVEVSRDGKRVYLTNSLYGAWDDQFYPDGVGAWLAKLDTDPAAGGGLAVDKGFFPHGDEFRGLRVHQVRLQGGDASSDSYCYR